MLKTKVLAIIGIFLFCLMGTAAFGQSNLDDAQDLYLAKRAFSDGFYEIALKHFQKYLEENPECDKDQVQLFMGRCYLKLEKFSEALYALQEVLERSAGEDKVTAQATYWTAQTYFAAKDYENALGFLKKIIEHYPESEFLAQSHYYRATCFYKRNQFNQALELYRDFNNSFSKHQLKEESSFHIGQCLYNVKDYQKANKEFNAFVKKFPESIHINAAFYYLGEIEYILGNFDNAVQYYIKATETSPKSKIAAFAKYGTGWAYLKLARYKEALEVFNVLEGTPGFGPALEDSLIFAQARCNACLENYTQAIQMYERIINDFPHSSWFDDAYFWKGQALYELKKYPQASRTYEQAIEKFPRGESPALIGGEGSAIYEREDLSIKLLDNLHYNLGWTYARMKKYAQAITQFEQVFKDSQERFLKSGALCRIGDIYLEQGTVKEAVENYDAVIKEFPDSYYADYAQYQLGVALSKEKGFDSAILAFNTLIANFPQSKFIDQAYYQIATIYFHQGEFSQAQEQLQDLIKEFPHSQIKTQATFLKAFAHYNSEDYVQALEVFKQVLRESTETKLKMKAQYQIGFCFYQMGKEENAINEFDKFLTLYSEDELSCDVLFWLGKYYYRQKGFPQAQKHFTRLRQNFPHNELADDALFWQAKALFNQGRLKASLDELQNLQTQYPDSELMADVILFKGDIFKSQGEIERAEDLYREVYEKFKEADFARIAHKKIAGILQEQRLFPEAIEELNKALGSGSGDFNAQVQFAIAQCWEEQQKLEQALDGYLKVCYLYPQRVPWARLAQLKCAQIFERQALWNQARSIYEELAKQDNPEADFARNRLKQLKKDQ